MTVNLKYFKAMGESIIVIFCYELYDVFDDYRYHHHGLLHYSQH